MRYCRIIESMPEPRMSSKIVVDALGRLSQLLARERSSGPIDLLIVGGAAGMLGGSLAPGRTTIDCDVMVIVPDDERTWSILRQAAATVAREHGLAANWLNDGARAWHDTLPPDWRDRQTLALDLDSIRIFIPSRVDLIVMKIIAGRDQDLDDLRDIRPMRSELDFARRLLQHWPHEHWPHSRIDLALETLGAFDMEAVE